MLSYTVESRTNGADYNSLRNAMRDVFGENWDVRPTRPTDFQMVLKAVPFGGMNLSQVTLSQALVTNCEHPSSRNTDHPYHIYILNRRQKVVTRNRTVILQPGDFTLADSSLATTMTTEQPYTTIGLTVPSSVLRSYIPEPDKAVGARFCGKTGLSKIVSYMLLAMWEHAETGELTDIGNRLTSNLLGIVSVCCQIHSHKTDDQEVNAEAKLDKIKKLINSGLDNPELCVGELAKEFGVSPRYIQRLFAEEDYTVSRYIRRQRLEGCRRQLADPAWLNHSITEIAFSWGFNSSAHFARVFKQQYGISAREFRKQALRGLSYYKDVGS